MPLDRQFLRLFIKLTRKLELTDNYVAVWFSAISSICGKSSAAEITRFFQNTKALIVTLTNWSIVMAHHK